MTLAYYQTPNITFPLFYVDRLVLRQCGGIPFGVQAARIPCHYRYEHKKFSGLSRYANT
jgi:hypothetical protein